MTRPAATLLKFDAVAAHRDCFVRVQNVDKIYAGRGAGLKAVDSVSLDLHDGEFLSIVGPSGCGKSTLMMMIAGLSPVSAGEITIKAEKVTGPYTDVGVVFQRDALLEWRTVLDNILLQIDVRRLRRADYENTAYALLERVGLVGFEKSYPWELSGGMRQRVSLCRALIHDPSLLLMDEPFGALDALTREQMNLDLQKIWMDTRKTMLFITHSIWEAIFLADHVIVMTPRPGRIAAIIKIDLPRPRRLAVRETAQFGRYAAMVREQFQAFGLLKEN
ncbi:MAG TPA: ABC transporter ATP-binding protein [Pseudolabrys sp.]|nr:ABC transporter ATP-binding protein [Pseudolabrys sp.]